MKFRFRKTHIASSFSGITQDSFAAFSLMEFGGVVEKGGRGERPLMAVRRRYANTRQRLEAQGGSVFYKAAEDRKPGISLLI
jgi:hypothetical protein